MGIKRTKLHHVRCPMEMQRKDLERTIRVGAPCYVVRTPLCRHSVCYSCIPANLVSQMVLDRRLLSEYSARYSIFVELLIFITNECAPPTRVKKTIILLTREIEKGVERTLGLHLGSARQSSDSESLRQLRYVS